MSTTTTTASAAPTLPSRASPVPVVVITDPGSVDPDDILAISTLLSFPPEKVQILGIVATHFFTEKRAKLVKLLCRELGRPDIPVFQSNAVDYGRVPFNQTNPLWPHSIFGNPKGLPQHPGGSVTKEWFPDFARSYEEHLGTDLLSDSLSLPLEQGEDSTTFLERVLSKHSPEQRLKVVCLGPLHDLARVDAKWYPHMDLWCMGGGFDEPTETVVASAQPPTGELPKEQTAPSCRIPCEKAGYNWGIAPDVVQAVLQKLTQTKTKMRLVSSNTVRRQNVSVTEDIFTKWGNVIPRSLPIVEAIMKDWSYCMKGNRLQGHKNLCDPLTLFLALTDTAFRSVPCHCGIAEDEAARAQDYLQSRNLIRMIAVGRTATEGNVDLVIDFDAPMVTSQILRRIEHVWFTFAHNRHLVEGIQYAKITAIKMTTSPEKETWDGLVEYQGLRFYCIPVDRADWVTAHPQEAKMAVFRAFNLPDGCSVVQVVGDCGPYFLEASQFCERLVEDLIKSPAESGAPPTLVQWGLTGKYFNEQFPQEPAPADYVLRDVNQMANELFDRRSSPSLGFVNVVDFHTPEALTKWGCCASLTARNYVLVYAGTTSGIEKGLFR